MEEQKECTIYTVWLRMGRLELIILHKFIAEVTESLKPLLKLTAPSSQNATEVCIYFILLSYLDSCQKNNLLFLSRSFLNKRKFFVRPDKDF